MAWQLVEKLFAAYLYFSLHLPLAHSSFLPLALFMDSLSLFDKGKKIIIIIKYVFGFHINSSYNVISVENTFKKIDAEK